MEQLVALPSEPIRRLGRARPGTKLSIEKGNLPTPIEKLEILSHLIKWNTSTDYTYEHAISCASGRSGIDAF